MMKILVILASGIGNSILFSPTLLALRKKFPKAKIDIFSYKKQFAEPFRDDPLINGVYYYNGLSTILKLKNHKYDISITAFPSNKWQFNLFAFLIGAKKRLTHSYCVGGWRTFSFLQNLKISADENLHDIDQNLNLLKLLNIAIAKNKRLIFQLNKKNRNFAEDFIKKNNLRDSYLMGVHPGSGPLKFKMSPLNKFIELIKRYYRRNATILIFGGSEEKEIKENLKNSLKHPSFIIDAPLKDTAALIKKCNLFITNDTGLMHIASTSKKTKIIALFNGTNPIRTSPYTKNSQVIILRSNKLKYPFYSTKAEEK